MRWNIALHAGIVVDKPGTTNLAMRLKYCVFNDISHLWKSVLELVGHEESGEASTNGEYFDLPWGVGEFGVELERIVANVIVIAY